MHRAGSDVASARVNTRALVEKLPSHADYRGFLSKNIVLECSHALIEALELTWRSGMLALEKEPKMEEGVARLEPRVARLEARVDQMSSDISEIKVEQRDLHKSMDSEFDAVNAKSDARFDKVDAKFDAVNARIDKLTETMHQNFAKMIKQFGDFKVWTLVVVAGGILNVVARALHWI